LWAAATAGSLPAADPATPPAPQTYTVRGEIKRLGPDVRRIVIRHEAVPGYMDAMTMPFNVRNPDELKGLQEGDEISFRLHVTATESWIDGLSRLKPAVRSAAESPDRPATNSTPEIAARHPLMDFKFTNECAQAVCLSDFHGQALAITFFFTRCPVPDFCPRLSRNFQEASRKLASLADGPTNWHFLSVTFDPAFDTPAILKVYAEHYQYNPAHWSFLTGPSDKINELARLSGVQVDPDAGLFNHNFRTLIVGANGQLLTTFPFGGDLSEPIVAEMLKACAATNESATPASTNARPAPVSPMVSGATPKTGRSADSN
jgi:protein SCO1/2